MSELHNLEDYKFALKMVEEIPLAVKHLEESYNSLVQYQNFTSVSRVLSYIEGAIMSLESNLPYFETVLKSKGGQVD